MTLAVRVVVIRVIVVVAHVQQVEIVARPLVSHARTTDRLRTGRTAASAASFATTAAAPTTSARLFFGAGIARFARVGIVIQFQEVIFPIVFHFVRQAFFATGILRAAARTTAIAAVIRPAVAVSAAAAFATPALAAAMLPTTPATPTTLRFTLFATVLISCGFIGGTLRSELVGELFGLIRFRQLRHGFEIELVGRGSVHVITAMFAMAVVSSLSTATSATASPPSAPATFLFAAFAITAATIRLLGGLL